MRPTLKVRLLSSAFFIHVATAWTQHNDPIVTDTTRRASSISCVFRDNPMVTDTTRRASSISCVFRGDDEEELDYLALQGDAGVILSYGCVQALFDVLERPLQALNPGLFLPVPHAPTQAMTMAALWVGITSLANGYRRCITRDLSSPGTVSTLLVAALGSSMSLVGVALATYPEMLSIEAELEFVISMLAALGLWRFCLSQEVPLP